MSDKPEVKTSVAALLAEVVGRIQVPKFVDEDPLLYQAFWAGVQSMIDELAKDILKHEQ